MRLLAPALLPSWRFFDVIEPSPRLQVAAWRGATDGEEPQWHDVPFVVQRRPGRPIDHDGLDIARRRVFRHGSLLLNPTRNDALYLVSCCSRVIEDGRPHAQREIAVRLGAIGRVSGLLQPDVRAGLAGFRFRILEVSRGPGGLERQVAFTSEPFTLDGVPLHLG